MSGGKFILTDLAEEHSNSMVPPGQNKHFGSEVVCSEP